MIRRATLDDVGALVSLARAFHATTPYAGQLAFGGAEMQSSIEATIADEAARLFVLDDLKGAFAYELYRSPIGPDLIASEKIWFVLPEARGRGLSLVKHAMRDAKARGADVFSLSAPDALADIHKLYAALGFAPMDRLFFKRF